MNRIAHAVLRLSRAFFMLAAVQHARADIYQWEYIDPAYPYLGKQQSSTLTPDGAGADAVPGANLGNLNLQMAYLYGANLTGANLTSARLNDAYFFAAELAGADFTGAEVRGASLPGSAITLTQLYSTASYSVRDLSGIDLSGSDLSNANFAGQNLARALFLVANLTGANLSQANLTGADFGTRCYPCDGANLSGANLSGANLTNASLSDANLSGADFTGAIVRGASLSAISSAQLYSTASYQAGDLSGIYLSGFYFGALNLSGWSFANLNLTNSYFEWLFLLNVDFTGADLRGATFAFADFSQSSSDNYIGPNGHISSLELNSGQLLIVRDYDGDGPRWSPNSIPPIPITVEQSFAMNAGGTLRMVFEEDAWDSTISFAGGIPVNLGGILELTFAADVDVTTQVGRTFDLFDWTGISPSGAFTISSPYSWNLSNLYTSGEITLLAVPEPSAIPLAFLGLLGLGVRHARRRVACEPNSAPFSHDMNRWITTIEPSFTWENTHDSPSAICLRT